MSRLQDFVVEADHDHTLTLTHNVCRQALDLNPAGDAPELRNLRALISIADHHNCPGPP